MSNKEIIINANTALTPSGWTDNVFVQIDKAGKISSVSKGKPQSLKTSVINVYVLYPLWLIFIVTLSKEQWQA